MDEDDWVNNHLALQEGARLLALKALRLNGEYSPKCGIFITTFLRSPVSGPSIAVVLKDIVQCPLFGVLLPANHHSMVQRANVGQPGLKRQQEVLIYFIRISTEIPPAYQGTMGCTK